MHEIDQGSELTNPATGQQRFANPLIIAWRRKGLLTLGLAAGLALGVLYYSQKDPLYESKAQVLVVKKRADAMPVAGSNLQQVYIEDYLSTHTVLLRSQDLLRRAGKLLEKNSPGVIPAGADAAAFIARGLTVARENRDGNTTPSNVLNISFRGRQPEDCPLVVNAVIDAYSEFLDETYGDLNKEFVNQMTNAQQVLQRDIQEKQAKHAEIAAQDPLSLKAKDALSSHQERIARLEAKRADLVMRKTEIKTSQEMIARSLKKGLSRNLIIKSIERSLAARPVAAGERSPEDLLLALQLQEEELRQEIGKDHPQLVALRRRMQVLRDRSARQPDPGEPSSSTDGLELHLQSLDRELEENDMLQATLEGILQEERVKATEMAKFLLEEEKARKAIEPLNQLYDNIIGRLQQIRVTGDVGGYRARTIVDANSGLKVAPSLIQTSALATIIGLMIGMGLAYLAEWTDKGFHSPEEIRQRLGLSVVGHIPLLPEPTVVSDPTIDAHLCVHQAPASRESEAFRGLRTSLYFSTQGRGHQIIQMTSANMGDGKSTLLANLAISIAQTGKSVVLMDADFRRPTVHRMFQLAGPLPGLATVLAGEAEIYDAVIPCAAVPGLSLLPCGPRPANPAELLTSPRFQELLALLREKYDFVLVDTPPLLAVSDPSVVAPRVDGVLLALRLSKNCRPGAERAREVLNSLGANILGVVVNGMDGDFGHYGYGDKYGYGYTDGYTSDVEPESDNGPTMSRQRVGSKDMKRSASTSSAS